MCNRVSSIFIPHDYAVLPVLCHFNNNDTSGQLSFVDSSTEDAVYFSLGLLITGKSSTLYSLWAISSVYFDGTDQQGWLGECPVYTRDHVPSNFYCARLVNCIIKGNDWLHYCWPKGFTVNNNKIRACPVCKDANLKYLGGKVAYRCLMINRN